MSGAHWGNGVQGGTDWLDASCSSWRGDPEEGLRSGVQACSDPLKGTCCKARCRTAVGGRIRSVSAEFNGIIAELSVIPECWHPVGGCPDQRAYL